MMIGIIGAGKLGGGLGKLWVRAGHQVLLSSCHPRGLKVLVEKWGPGGYVLFGDIILFSADFCGLDDALEAAGPLKGNGQCHRLGRENPNGSTAHSLSRSTTTDEELAKRGESMEPSSIGKVSMDTCLSGDNSCSDRSAT